MMYLKKYPFFIRMLLVVIFLLFPVLYCQGSLVHQDSETIIFAGENGIFIKSTDSGNNWFSLNTGITNVIFSAVIHRYLNETNEENILYYSSCSNGLVLKSNEKSGGWDLLNTGFLNDLKSISVTESGIFVCGSSGLILNSSNSGVDWNVMNSGTEDELNAIIFPDKSTFGNRIYPVAAGNNGRILISRNSGLSWVTVTSGTEFDLNTAVYGEKQNVFAAGNNGTILRSEDGGNSWQTLYTGVLNNINNIVYLKTGDLNKLAASCDNGIILISNNLGNTWDIIQTPFTLDLFSVSFYGIDTGIASADSENMVYTVNGGNNWHVLNVSSKLFAKDTEIFLLNNFPNPFNPVTTIKYVINFEGLVTLKIYDITGREVKTLLNSVYKTKGSYTEVLDAANLSSGFYFYTLQFNSKSKLYKQTNKMLLIK